MKNKIVLHSFALLRNFFSARIDNWFHKVKLLSWIRRESLLYHLSDKLSLKSIYAKLGRRKIVINRYELLFTRGENTYVSGRTSFGIRQCAGFRARFGGVGSKPRPEARQFIMWKRGALGRWFVPLQLH